MIKLFTSKKTAADTAAREACLKIQADHDAYREARFARIAAEETAKAEFNWERAASRI